MSTPPFGMARPGARSSAFPGAHDRFSDQTPTFDTLEDLNLKARHWIEENLQRRHHSGIGMIPLDPSISTGPVQYLADDAYTEEVFFVEEDRKVNKTNLFSIQPEIRVPGRSATKSYSGALLTGSTEPVTSFTSGQRMGCHPTGSSQQRIRTRSGDLT